MNTGMIGDITCREEFDTSRGATSRTGRGRILGRLGRRLRDRLGEFAREVLPDQFEISQVGLRGAESAAVIIPAAQTNPSLPSSFVFSQLW
jgi:hypothetical protein